VQKLAVNALHPAEKWLDRSLYSIVILNASTAIDAFGFWSTTKILNGFTGFLVRYAASPKEFRLPTRWLLLNLSHSHAREPTCDDVKLSSVAK
jgi:hypothetical protein